MINDNEGPPPYANVLRSVTHELGHAIGLDHEHSRPDRDTYLRFTCESLTGYDAAAAEVMKPTSQEFHPGATVEQRMDQVCNDFNLAKKYFPILAYGYMRGDLGQYHGILEWNLQGAFDFGSIMIYSSEQGMRDHTIQAMNNFRMPLMRKLPLGAPRTPVNVMMFTGGSITVDQISISLQDIKRVGVLYPGSPVQQQNLAQLRQWRGGRVTVNRLFDGDIQPAPVDVVGPDLLPIDGNGFGGPGVDGSGNPGVPDFYGFVEGDAGD